jgi:hypothetical protein
MPWSIYEMSFRTDMAKCVPNKRDKGPLAPCETCLRVRRESKKTIHYIPCLRFKVPSMVIYRAGGLGYTQRFDHTKVVDVLEYADNVIHVIDITQGLCSLPLRLRVRRFKPRATDKTHWSYVDHRASKIHGTPRTHRTSKTHDTVPESQHTVSRSQDSGPFCLADVEKTAREFDQYIASNAVEGLAEVVKDRDPDDIVRRVFTMIATLCSSPSVRPHPPRDSCSY